MKTSTQEKARWTAEAVAESLRALKAGEVRALEPMADHTSIRLGGPADVLIKPNDPDALATVMKFLRQARVPWLVMGSGSQLLFRDGGFAGVVIHLGALNRVEALDGPPRRVWLEAGCPLAMVAEALGGVRGGVEASASSTETGTLGGALGLLAGERFKMIEPMLEAVDVMRASGRVQRIGSDRLRDEEGNVRLPRGAIVVRALLLTGGTKGEAARGGEPRRLERLNTTPMVRAVFRDPELPRDNGLLNARQLIARSGLRGVRIRGARISEQDPNRIVNVGTARTSDVITLIRLIRDRVRREHGILLEPRAKVVGRALEELPV